MTLFLMQPRLLLDFFAVMVLLLFYVKLVVHQDPEVLLCRAAFHQVTPQPLLVHGAVPPQVKNFAFEFAELHEIPAGPFQKPAQVPRETDPLSQSRPRKQIGLVSFFF